MTDEPRPNLACRLASGVLCLSALSAGCVTRQATETVLVGDPSVTSRPSEQEAAKQTEALDRLQRPWLFDSAELKLRLTVPAGWAQWPLAEPDGSPARRVAQFTRLWDPIAKQSPAGIAIVSIDWAPADEEIKALARTNAERAVELAANRYAALAAERGFATGNAPAEAMQVGGREARRLNLRSSGGGRSTGALRQTVYVTLAFDRLYVFAGTTNDERTAEFRATLDAMVSSVRWTE
jgi:hypothetical protein